MNAQWKLFKYTKKQRVGNNMGPHIIAIAIGLILDRIIGDPPSWPHPVRVYRSAHFEANRLVE